MWKLIEKEVLIILFLILLSTITFGQLSLIGAGTAPTTPPTSGFAIDGSLRKQGTAGDWLEGPNGSPIGSFLLNDELSPLFTGAAFTWVTDTWNSNSDEVFKGGNNKFSDDPNSWKWQYKKSASRNDMNNALMYFALDNSTGHFWGVFAVDRFDKKGYSYIDFEFFQNGIARTTTTGNSEGGFSSLGPDNGRTIGDVVFSVALGDNGNLSDAEISQWQPTGDPSQPTYQYFPLSFLPTGIVFSATNTTPIEVPFGAFGSTIYPTGTFAEVAVDLTSILGGFGGPRNCNLITNLPFKSILIKSRTSLASNAQLIDFIDPINLPPNLTFGVNVAAVPLDLYTVELTASVSPGTVDDYFFSWEPSEFNPPGGTLSNNNSYTTLFTTTNPETCVNYVYKLTSRLKSEPNCSYSEARVTIRPPCKIGKPINPDRPYLERNEARDGNTNNEILIFPNPSKGTATIILPDIDGTKDIQLIDMKGAVIQHWKYFTGNSLQFKNLTSGLYLLKTVTIATGKISSKKIIITR